MMVHVRQTRYLILLSITASTTTKPIKDIKAIMEKLKKNEMTIKRMGTKYEMKKLKPHFFPDSTCFCKHDSTHWSLGNSFSIAFPVVLSSVISLV